MIALRGARVATVAGVREGWWVTIAGDTIVAVGPEPGAGATTVDLGAVDLLPGLVDLHSDCLEERLRPRPTSEQPIASALIQLDGEAALHGITTHFVCASFEDDALAGRSTAQAARIVETVDAWRHRLRVDHRVHLRFELTSAAFELARRLAAMAPVGMISYMDHSPGQGQFPEEASWRSYYARRFTGDEDALDELLARRRARQDGAEDRREAIAALARERGALLASHDDDTAATVLRAVALDAAIAEFPLNAVAARAAAAAGLGIVMGAPNARRGGSHMNGASARDFLAAGWLDALASDYHPPSLLAAVYQMEADGGCTFERAVELVSGGPARIAGLADRGRIEVGARADLVAVAVHHGEPMVRQTWVAGAPCLGAGEPQASAWSSSRPRDASSSAGRLSREHAGAITVRPAAWDDADAIVELIEAMGGHHGAAERPGTLPALGALIERPTVRTLVAQAAGRLAGYLELHARPSAAFGVTEGWIASLVVDPALRGRGIGRRLLEVAQDEAALLGCSTLTVDSSVLREDAHRFYRREGFAEVTPARRFRRPLVDAVQGGLEQRFLRAAALAVDAVAGALAGRERHLPAGGGFDTADKQTDLAAEDVAVAVLELLGLSILSEESGLFGPAPQADMPWISLDPIDGTRNCMHGVSPWATTIGLVRAGAPLAGLVVDHASGRRWWAGSSGPARVDGHIARPRPGGLVALPSTPPQELDRACVPGADGLGLSRARIVGCTSVDLCRVADGSTGAFVDVTRAISRVHDIAGAMAVLRGAGAVIVGLDGQPPQLEPDVDARFCIVAAPTAAHAHELLAGRHQLADDHAR